MNRYTLYADRTPATDEAIKLLKKANVDYRLILTHEISPTPALEWADNTFVGLEGIASFCESVKNGELPRKRET